jgi:hypothetical protein
VPRDLRASGLSNARHLHEAISSGTGMNPFERSTLDRSDRSAAFLVQCRVKTGQTTPGPLLTGVRIPFKIVILAGDGQGPLDHGGETFEVVVREQGAGIPPEQRSVGDDVAQMSSRLYSAFANQTGMTLECVRSAPCPPHVGDTRPGAD